MKPILLIALSFLFIGCAAHNNMTSHEYCIQPGQEYRYKDYEQCIDDARQTLSDERNNDAARRRAAVLHLQTMFK